MLNLWDSKFVFSVIHSLPLLPSAYFLGIVNHLMQYDRNFSTRQNWKMIWVSLWFLFPSQHPKSFIWSFSKLNNETWDKHPKQYESNELKEGVIWELYFLLRFLSKLFLTEDKVYFWNKIRLSMNYWSIMCFAYADVLLHIS